MFLKTLPAIDISNHIPDVNATNWITMLDNGPACFSVVKIPIKIPNAIKRIDIGINDSAEYTIFIDNGSFSNIATAKNNNVCTMVNGNSANEYPITYSWGFIGLENKRDNKSDEVSLDINVAVNNVINE